MCVDIFPREQVSVAQYLDFLEDRTGEARLVSTRCVGWPGPVGNDLNSIVQPGQPEPSSRAFQKFPGVSP